MTVPRQESRPEDRSHGCARKNVEDEEEEHHLVELDEADAGDCNWFRTALERRAFRRSRALEPKTWRDKNTHEKAI